MAKMAIIVKFLSCIALVVITNTACSEAKLPLGSRLYTQNTSTWLSASANFAFGFYKKADGFAVGIWLQESSNSEPLITWTANRDNPPIPPEAYLEFTTKGRLLLYTQQSILDVFNLTNPGTSFSLLDSGNLVAYNGSEVIWQSFDYPTDTILGGQAVKLGYNMYSSISTSDHSQGRFMLAFQMDGNLVAYPVNVTTAPAYSYWSSGTTGSDTKNLVLTARGELYLNSSSVHVIASSQFHDNGAIFRATFDADGILRLYSHFSGNSTPVIVWSAVNGECDVRGYCGANSYCSFDASGKGSEKCICFPGFLYLDAERKFLGCYRNFTYKRFCGRAEESVASTDQAMIMLENTRIGGYPYASAEMVEQECGDTCRKDCNCWTALYQSGSCRKFRPPLMYSTQSNNYSEIAFVRQVNINDTTQWNVSSTGENGFLDGHKSKKEWKLKRKMILILAPPLGLLSIFLTLLALLSFLLFTRRAAEYQKLMNMENFGLNKDFTLRSFSYGELEKATDGFRRALGNVSYGKIYEGIINEGERKVAVNRLEKEEPEVEREFIAEITAMGRVYHKNVVQLVGFCLEGAKKRLLVYEFMTNRSLADILYDVEKRPVWKQRMKIALGVARGIRYLHEECDTRIVHCKIKPKNVLVDDDFTAKICGFGFSKLLKPCEAEDREKRGYSAPEWRKSELISEKVDVYSYGVLLLEIICCSSDDDDLNVQNPKFSSEVYKRYFKSKELRKLIGEDDEKEVDIDSLERYLKVGLCCVQDDSDLRPSMKNVIMMLEGTLATPIPLPPAESILP